MVGGCRRAEQLVRCAALSRAWAWVAALLAAAGCGDGTAPQDLRTESLLYDAAATEQLLGGQTGDGTGYSEDDAPCPSESRPLELDEAPGELGFSAREVLAGVEQGVSSTLAWTAQAGVETSPETGTSSVQLSFEYRAGGVRLHTPVSNTSEAPDAECRPWIEVDVVARIATGGGALDESFDARLSATRPGVVGFSGSIAANELRGALEVRSESSIERFFALDVAGVSTPFGSHGVLVGRFALSFVGDPGSEQVGEEMGHVLAEWPADSGCPSGWRGLEVPDEAAVLGATVMRWRHAFDATPPSPLRWDDGAATQLELQVRAGGDTCYRTEWWSPLDSLSFTAQISARTRDGRWAGDYLGRIGIASSAGAAPTRAGLAVVRSVLPEELPSLGVTAPSEIGADSLALQLGLSRELASGELNGQLRVSAMRELDCYDAASRQSDECLAAQNEDVVSAVIGSGESDPGGRTVEADVGSP